MNIVKEVNIYLVYEMVKVLAEINIDSAAGSNEINVENLVKQKIASLLAQQ